MKEDVDTCLLSNTGRKRSLIEYLGAASGKVCEKCAATGFTATKLRPDLPAEIRDYFHNSHLVLKKYLKVVDFQKGHREALHRHRTEEVFFI